MFLEDLKADGGILSQLRIVSDSMKEGMLLFRADTGRTRCTRRVVMLIGAEVM